MDAVRILCLLRRHIWDSTVTVSVWFGVHTNLILVNITYEKMYRTISLQTQINIIFPAETDGWCPVLEYLQSFYHTDIDRLPGL